MSEGFGKNGGTVLGKIDLGDDAVRLEIGEPSFGIPVAVAVLALHVLVGHFVLRGPGVEVIVQRGRSRNGR